MNKNIVIITFLIAIGIGFLFFFQFKEKSVNFLEKPDLKVESPSLPVVTIEPSPTPKTYKFDKSTDLKKELEDINPQVLETDFQ